eukprot:gene11517-biopygen9187
MTEEASMREVEEVLLCTTIACASIIYVDLVDDTKPRNRRVWCKDYFRERDERGAYKMTLEELRFSDPFSFRRYLRMSAGNFEGRISDGGVYKHSSFYQSLQNGSLGLPEHQPLPQSDDPQWVFSQNADPLPFVFVADDAFPLGLNCMKPYPQANLTDRKRIFNYRLSRVRRLSENVFGIWANRFRVFTTTMALDPDKAVDVTLATIVLHNFLRNKSKDTYTGNGVLDEEGVDGDVVPGDWREDPDNLTFLQALPATKNKRASLSATQVREALADHFYGPGQIPWQWQLLV